MPMQHHREKLNRSFIALIRSRLIQVAKSNLWVRFLFNYWKQYIAGVMMCISISACTNMFFYPVKEHVASPEQFDIEYEDIFIDSYESHKIHGWWFPAKLDEDQLAKANIIFLHGNAENISTHSGLVYWLTQYQYNVFIFDYRGYGKSTGDIELAGMIEDINSARAYVKSRNYENTKTYIMGHSLGASLAIVNVAQKPDGVDGVVLVSPFSDYQKIAQEAMSKSWLTWLFQWMSYLTVSDVYNPIDYVSVLPTIPKLFIYSESDEIISPAHIKELYGRSSKNKYLEISKGNHNDVFAYPDNQKMLLDHLSNW